MKLEESYKFVRKVVNKSKYFLPLFSSSEAFDLVGCIFSVSKKTKRSKPVLPGSCEVQRKTTVKQHVLFRIWSS